MYMAKRIAKHRKPRSANQGAGTKAGRRGKRGTYDYGKPIIVKTGASR